MVAYDSDAPEQSPALKAEQLSFSYAAGSLFTNFNLSVAPGEFLGLIGPNGSGKSTLLRLLTYVLKPKSGRIFCAKRCMSELPRREIARLIAFVPQDVQVVSAFTCREMVAMGLYARHSGLFASETDRDLINKCLNDTGMLDFADKFVSEISGGELQRVRIAQALAQQTPILLLDEATAHLDISYQTEIMDLVYSLNKKRGLTVIMALHDLNAASQYCRRIVCLQRGQIVADGTAHEVLTKANLQKFFGVDAEIRPGLHERPAVLLKSSLDEAEWP